MANYTYKLENGEYIIYEDGKVLKTPHDAVIKTNNEDFAKLVITHLEHDAGYTAPSSLLTYHYTFCNLNTETTKEVVANDFSKCACYDALMSDDYLMFRQPSPVKQAIAVYYEKELPENFQKYNLFQLTAILVIQTAYHSWMLSQYIIADIIEKLNEDKDADFAALKEEFLDDLEDFECEEFGCDPDDDGFIRHLKEIGDMIDVFTYFFCMET